MQAIFQNKNAKLSKQVIDIDLNKNMGELTLVFKDSKITLDFQGNKTILKELADKVGILAGSEKLEDEIENLEETIENLEEVLESKTNLEKQIEGLENIITNFKADLAELNRSYNDE